MIDTWDLPQNLQRLSPDCSYVVPGVLATHSLRKTFAHKIYERLGKDLLKTQMALGHKSITSTVQYLSFSEAEIDRAIRAI